MGIAIVATLLLALAAPAAEVSSDDFYAAIRGNNLVQLKTLIAQGGNINLKDRRGATPLMHAALIGSLDAMKLLLAAGADVNARNTVEATALMWSLPNAEKVRLLVDAGADVNARSKAGLTPLLIAASNPGSIGTVRLLLDKGADLKAASPGGFTALLAAAAADDIEMLQLFIEKGLDVNATTGLGTTALQSAAGCRNLAAVKLLLEKGARVDAATTDGGMVLNGPIALKNLTPLMMAAPYGSPELLSTLLDAGAQPNAKDVRGMTPLMLAVASETQNPAVVRLLLAKGADVKLKSAANETATDWACKYGNPTVMHLLKGSRAAAAPNALTGLNTVTQAALREAVAKSLPLMQQSSTEFFKKSACVGCHHQNLTALAVSTARRKGVPVDEAVAAEQLKAVKVIWAAQRETLVQRIDAPGSTDAVTYSLIGMAAENYPADAITDAMVLNVAAQQRLSGAWDLGDISRSPIEESNLARTALALRSLQLYAPPALRPEMEMRIARARAYLLEAQPRTTDDRAMQLLGLKWCGAEPAKLQALAKALVSEQRPDGGWAQNPHLASDAYGTGEALYGLYESGTLAASDAAYQRGLVFLLKTQKADGSWYVKSRAPKFQPYFESGFPYGHDQWISAAATAWAATALANGIAQ
ncbi:MAG: ankyrin repeat domain-containing protein [Candidatus Solibacter usitatus]|nr:ankyrin repeat domain-containing protein [Candidatus Solibacter usitatus]